jgi:hypothetical protein
LTRGNDHFRLNSLGTVSQTLHFTTFAYGRLRASTALPDHVDLLNRKGGVKFKDLEYAGTETAEQLLQDMFNGSSVEMRKAIVSLSKKICSSLELLSNSAETESSSRSSFYRFLDPNRYPLRLKNALELPKANALKRARIP